MGAQRNSFHFFDFCIFETKKSPTTIPRAQRLACRSHPAPILIKLLMTSSLLELGCSGSAPLKR